MTAPQTALKFDAEVTKEGRIELSVPLPAGSHVTVFVLEQLENRFADLSSAAESSLGFWDNPIDDEDWNDA
ncbi:MAG TPA: hypothetical protein VK395_22500 [Gemmataceae bacterium]|nr:hypothetical protein [Gemmataceae bacterium]